jgi:hypothetical protein
MALRAGNSALHWTATRPEDNTPATAVAVGHFVQVGIPPGTPFCGISHVTRRARAAFLGRQAHRTPEKSGHSVAPSESRVLTPIQMSGHEQASRLVF